MLFPLIATIVIMIATFPELKEIRIEKTNENSRRKIKCEFI